MLVILGLAREKAALFRLSPVIGYFLQRIQPKFRIRMIAYACVPGRTHSIGPVVCHRVPNLPLRKSSPSMVKKK